MQVGEVVFFEWVGFCLVLGWFGPEFVVLVGFEPVNGGSHGNLRYVIRRSCNILGPVRGFFGSRLPSGFLHISHILVGDRSFVSRDRSVGTKNIGQGHWV